MYIGKQLIRGQNNIIDDISSGFNGSTTAFSLTASGDAVSPATVNQMFVSLGGVLQKPGTDFTLSSSTITFTTAPTSGLSFWCLVQGDSVDLNAPSDGSVTPSKISANGDFAFPADIRLKDSDGSHYVGLQAPATVGSNVVWTLPAADGTANYVLKTDGSGNLGWAADSSTDSTKMPLAGGSFTGDVVFTGDAANVTWDKSTDDLIFNDNAKAAFGTGSDLQIYHDGSNSYITDSGTGYLIIKGSRVEVLNAAGNEVLINAVEDGAVELHHNGTKKFGTESYGISVDGTIAPTNHVNLVDDKKAQFGAGYDLQIYHNGLNSIIQNSTGWLVLGDGGSGTVIKGAANENAISCTANGAVEVYHDASLKLSTSATGISVTGAVSDSKGDVRKIVQNYQTGAYVLVVGDAGKCITITTGGVTVNPSIFSSGDAVSIVNHSGSNQTITQGSSFTLYNTSDGTTGNRTLAGRGMATLFFTDNNIAYISGAGLS